jgi:hypothetical protein
MEVSIKLQPASILGLIQCQKLVREDTTQGVVIKDAVVRVLTNHTLLRTIPEPIRIPDIVISNPVDLSIDQFL